MEKQPAKDGKQTRKSPKEIFADLEVKISTLETKATEQANEIKTLRGERDYHKREAEGYKSKLDAAQTKCKTTCQTAYKKLEDQRNKLTEDYKRKDEELYDLQTHYGALEADLKQCKDNLAGKDGECKDLDRRLKNEEIKHSETRKESLKKDRTIDDKGNIIIRLTEENSESKTALGVVRAKIDDEYMPKLKRYEAEAKASDSKYHDLEEELKTAQEKAKEIDRLKAVETEYNANKGSWEKEMTDKDKMIKGTEPVLKGKDDRIKYLESELTKSGAQCAQFEKQAKESDGQARNLGEQLTARDSKIREYENKLREQALLKESAEKLRQEKIKELEDMRADRDTWKAKVEEYDTIFGKAEELAGESSGDAEPVEPEPEPVPEPSKRPVVKKAPKPISI
jgi:chromosome segregation ATPase